MCWRVRAAGVVDWGQRRRDVVFGTSWHPGSRIGVNGEIFYRRGHEPFLGVTSIAIHTRRTGRLPLTDSAIAPIARAALGGTVGWNHDEQRHGIRGGCGGLTENTESVGNSMSWPSEVCRRIGRSSVPLMRLRCLL